jgi:nucleoid-associated protein YgaU
MGNFEKLSVLVIVVIIVMILVVAIYTWTDNPDASATADAGTTTSSSSPAGAGMSDPVGPGGFPPAPPSRTPMVGPQGGGTPGSGLAVLPSGLNPLNPSGGTSAGGTGTAGTTSGGLGAPVSTTETTPADATPSEPRVHVVASGDNLTKIAKKYFASTGQRYVDAIAKANPGVDPNRLRVNQKLTIPSDRDVPAASARGSASGAGGGGSSSTATTGSGPKAGSTYTVRRGDKLPDIARRAYGSSENWHLIWLENFTTIRDPDEVAVGTKLKIPHVH